MVLLDTIDPRQKSRGVCIYTTYVCSTVLGGLDCTSDQVIRNNLVDFFSFLFFIFYLLSPFVTTLVYFIYPFFSYPPFIILSSIKPTGNINSDSRVRADSRRIASFNPTKLFLKSLNSLAYMILRRLYGKHYAVLDAD